MKKYLHILFTFLLFFSHADGQTIYSGKVIDVYTKNPVPAADIFVVGTNITFKTDNLGRFGYTSGVDDEDYKTEYEIKAFDNKIYWFSEKNIDLKIYTILGQETGFSGISLIGNGEFDFAEETPGIYFLSVVCNGKRETLKIVKNNNSLLIQDNYKRRKKDTLIVTNSFDTLLISKEGYHFQKFAYQADDLSYEILKTGYNDIDYLDKITRPEAYIMLQGLPLNPTFGEVKSLKIVYSIPDEKIYYSNSKKYFIHYDFCSQVLGYNKGHASFNQEQYTKNDNRIYILASLNHFTSSGIYTLEFFSGDELNCDDIEKVFKKVAETFFKGDSLRFYANSSGWIECTNVPVISSEELYKGQNYQPLNPQTNFGYLKKVTIDELPGTYLGRHDIVLLNGIPVDIAVVAGIITTEFQTPLSHINVLSHNRGTPNMALRDGWTNPKLNDLLDKLVYLKVTLDSFYIREATLQEAQNYWAQKEPQTPRHLEMDTISSGLVNLTSAGINSVNLIGGKASNFAELTKVNVVNYGPLPLPEGYFAIPFYYYHHHIKKYGLDVFIDKMLKDTVFQKDITWRRKQLSILQDSIKNSPLDTNLFELVKERVSGLSFTNIRFRSSTNAEDIEGFNGAGLYDSYTGTLTDPKKTIDRAIKKVWASLWNFGAFEERDYFKIDHKTVAMGVLVHRSYPAEAANGVVITKNLYNPRNSAITINVQIGEISVVSPEDNYLPDQILYYTYSNENILEYINHSNVPGMEGKTVMTNEELKVLKDYCMAIHYHYCRLFFECKTLDIEFKVDLIGGQRKVYIKQARIY